LVGNYKEAEASAEKFVGLASERYGEGRPIFATAVDWLGLILKGQGRYGEAEPPLDWSFFLRALC
jgi:hypothetical protein